MNATLQKTRVEDPKIVSPAEWTQARKRLMAREREVARQVDELNAERRMLPWVRVEKEYVFDSPSGKVTLADLFDGLNEPVDFAIGILTEAGVNLHLVGEQLPFIGR